MSATDVTVLIAGMLLALGPLAVAARRLPGISGATYTAACGLSLILAGLGLAGLAGHGVGTGLVLPLGLPWIGAHLQLDALSAFFLVILGVGGGVTSLYAIGYGRHEHAPMRVLAFYPAFLGAMALVLLAADAFSFLLCWEVMSLLSWALVLTHHREEETRTGGLCLSGDGGLRHHGVAAGLRPAGGAGRRLRL